MTHCPEKFSDDSILMPWEKPEKSEHCKIGDFIGWIIDSDTVQKDIDET